MTHGEGPSQRTKIAIVTGGSRGLGRSIVLNLSDRGIRTLFTYKTNEAQAAKVVALARERGAEATALRLDTGRTDTFGPFVDEVRQTLARSGASRFDYLVNNAGTSHHAPFAETTEADFDGLYQVHLKGVFFLTQKLLPMLNDGGSILNVSTGLARFALPGYAAYAAMKGAIEVLTRYLAKELGPRQIRVNTLAPGAIETDFSGGIVRDNKDMNARIAAMAALGRAGLPEDIGGLVACLLDPKMGWVTAQRIEASGGMLI